MKKHELDVRLNQFLLENDHFEEMFYDDSQNGDRTIFGFVDNYMAKEITFTPEENMTKKWLSEKIHIQSRKEESEYIFDFNGICDFILSHANKELFTTLDSIFFVFDEEGLKELETYTGDSYAFDCIDLDEYIGMMWYEKNIVIINVSLIEKMAKENADEFIPANEQVSSGIVTTLVHELRHLMTLTNVLLTDKECTENDKLEESVENYARNFEDINLISIGTFVNIKK